MRFLEAAKGAGNRPSARREFSQPTKVRPHLPPPPSLLGRVTASSSCTDEQSGFLAEARAQAYAHWAPSIPPSREIRPCSESLWLWSCCCPRTPSPPPSF